MALPQKLAVAPGATIRDNTVCCIAFISLERIKKRRSNQNFRNTHEIVNVNKWQMWQNLKKNQTAINSWSIYHRRFNAIS